MHRRALLLALAAALLTTPLLAPAEAQARPPQRQAQQGPISLSQAAEMVRQKVGGKVLAAEHVRGSNGGHYQIRMLVQKGKVKVYRVDPQTGRIY